MTHQTETHALFRPYLALVLAILSLGMSAIFVRWANAPSAVTNAYRMGIASLLLAGPFFQRVRIRGGISKRGLWFAVMAGMFFAADLFLWTQGVNLSGATNPTLLANTAPVWVGLGALVLFRERHAMVFWLGVGLAFAGAAVILGVDGLRDVSLGVGSLYGLAAGVFYAGYFLLTQRGRESLDAVTYFWPSAFTSAICMVVVALALGQPFTGYSSQTYLNFVGLGIVTQIFGYLAISYALGRIPASLVSPTMLGQPVVTALIAGPLLGEYLQGGQILGGVMVLAGVFFAHRSRTQRAS